MSDALKESLLEFVDRLRAAGMTIESEALG